LFSARATANRFFAEALLLGIGLGSLQRLERFLALLPLFAHFVDIGFEDGTD
jgi:hypothetical protein